MDSWDFYLANHRTSSVQAFRNKNISGKAFYHKNNWKLSFKEVFYNISTIKKLSDIVAYIGVLNKENEDLLIKLDDIPPIYAKPYFPNIKFEVDIEGLVSQLNATLKIRF